MNINGSESAEAKTFDSTHTNDNIAFQQMSVTEQMLVLLEKINNIEHSLASLHHKIDQGDLAQNCQKMASHVDFVESVYENVKKPMYFVCNQINSLTGIGTSDVSPALR